MLASKTKQEGLGKLKQPSASRYPITGTINSVFALVRNLHTHSDFHPDSARPPVVFVGGSYRFVS